MKNKKPVVAIYSTFLQRAYDQLIHDVALQNLNVLFAIDRAGLVGEDGPTHSGNYDLTYLRCIPNMMIVAVPADENEARKLLTTAFIYNGPAAVRYPRGGGINSTIELELDPVEVGKGRVMIIREGIRHARDEFWSANRKLLQEVAQELNATLLDMRFVKPLDKELINEVLKWQNKRSSLLRMEPFLVAPDQQLVNGFRKIKCSSKLSYVVFQINLLITQAELKCLR